MKEKIVRGKCIDLSFEGKGVLKTEEGIVFVDGLFIGEEAEAKVLYTRNGSNFGKVHRLITKSPDRIQPLCGVCTACGGCQFQQLSYEAQLAFKTNKVKSAIHRKVDKGLSINPCLGMDNPYYYRNKVQVPLGLDNHNHIISGFYRKNSHEIIPIDTCYIENEVANEILKVIKKLMREFKYEPYNEDTRYGLFRHILIRNSYHFDEVMVTIITNKDEFKGKNNFVKELVRRCPKITTVVQNINTRDTNVILGEKQRILYGPGYIRDSILTKEFLISSKSFYQVNPVQVEKLYDLAIKSAELTKNDRVLDAYCGIGTIGLIASDCAKDVVGVEVVSDAIKDAKKNAKLNRVENIAFICGDAGQIMEQYAQENKEFDVVFVDPPRKGLDDKFINSLLKIKPNRVVYVSCEPESLADNLSKLAKSYSIKSIIPVDMFPMTAHVETICLLTKK